MKTMVIVAHPNLKDSRANQALADALQGHADVDVRDLYLEYPDWRIDVEKEQRQLLQYDRIVFQFPFYWYSCPPLLKKWMDDVFTYGWAFGPGGEHLKGKEFVMATTTGGPENGYQPGGYNAFTVGELLRSIQNTIMRCHGTYLPIFVSYGAAHLSDGELAQEALRYAAYVRTPVLATAH
ncbi:NAD(P)H-dependent oxidoreductase [Cohnella nanjingensis]|uniref:NAD(P)H-dependent oxidoreductase n=1 Tax=Cohnella nanjingensis TaxID=1387779 RepID=A0A7X0VEN2_9BACL|nr:NAD(P)H-dependent oxidoreductase [Cohnella nanjingensis]MBB6671185.1 NAD(P)H-dependent oxidoreductase [Cohnella nanjingensis]